MRRGLLLIAVAAVAVLAVGCAQTDYPCITDTSQTDDSSGFVATNGKAHIAEFFQIAVILPGPVYIELVNFLDQKNPPNGVPSSSMYNYEHRTTSGVNIFHDDQYCNADSTSCSAYTNTNNAFCNDGSGKGGVKIATGPCSDGLGLLAGDIIRDSECGRAGVTDPMEQLGGISLIDALNLIASNSSLVEVDGVSWHEMVLDPQMTFSFDNGAIYDVSFPAGGVPSRVRLTEDFRFQALVDLSSPDMVGMLHELQAIADANPGVRFGISGQMFGYSLNLPGSFRLVDSELVPNFYADKASRLYGS